MACMQHLWDFPFCQTKQVLWARNKGKIKTTKRVWKSKANDERVYSQVCHLGAVGFTLPQNGSLGEKEYILMSADASLLSASIDSALGFSSHWSPPPEPVGDISMEFRLSLEIPVSQPKLVGENLAVSKLVSYATFSLELSKQTKRSVHWTSKKRPAEDSFLISSQAHSFFLHLQYGSIHYYI